MAQLITRPILLSVLLSALLTTVLACSGCSKPQTLVDGKIPINIGGKTFVCEIVADDESRTLGLGQRESLGANEGMIFSFPDSRLRSFIMRDCLFDIDIIFLDSAGRIVAMHHMPMEEPKREDESQLAYELRLAKYSSRFNAQYVIELLGGTLETLTLSDGDRIDLDTDLLQSLTQ